VRSPRVLHFSVARVLGLGAMSLLGSACGEDLTSPSSDLAISVSTVGSSPDQDGYTLSIDGAPSIAIASNGALTKRVEPGNHSIVLGGLAANCGIEGGAQRDIQVPPGQTTNVRFDVVCGATTGGLRLVTTTNGVELDPDGYAVTVDHSQPQPISVNGTITLTDIAVGDHTVQLLEVAQNCAVTADNPRTVSVPAGGLVDVVFDVVCSAVVLQWTPMTSGTTADLQDVWGSSATDVFVVGQFFTEDDFGSVIRHFDGTGWVEQLSEVDLQLQGVWGSSASDVYAVGFDFFQPDAARVLHFDGTRWSEVPGFTAGQFEESVALQSVWGSSATDVFAVGSAFDGEFNLSAIFHFDGSNWLRVPVTGTVAPGLADVWGSSPTDVYAVGRNDVAEPATGVILRYDGTRWAPVLEQEGLALSAVWGSSASDVFAAGFRVEGPEEDPQIIGTILHFDGNSWSPASLPATGVLNEVWGSSATDVFSVGEAGVILHYDGTAWTAITPTTSNLLGIWGSSLSDAFAVGEAGTILHGTP
jgi:hypothetical protein